MRYVTRFVNLAVFFIFLGTLSPTVVAQTWSRTYSYPSGGVPFPTSITQTTDGGFVASGYSGAGAWIAKLNPVGDIQWSQAISGWAIWPQAIETLDGGFAMGSVISITGADGCYDVRFDLAKFDSTGAPAWHKQYGPDQVRVGGSCVGGQANARSMIETPDGSFLMSGMIDDSGDLLDLWLVKADSTGNVVWQKRYDSPESGKQQGGGEKIGLLPGGGIVLVGHGTSYSVGGDDVWVLWLDANGEIVNQRAYGGIQIDWPYDLHVTDNGDVIIAVYSQSWGNHFNPWLLKLDSGGVIVSQRTYLLWNQFTAQYPRIDELPNGNLVLTAQTNGDGSGLAEISVDGSPLWSKYSYPDTRGPYAVTAIAGGGFLMASSLIFNADFFTLTRTDAVGGIDISCPINDAIGSYTDTSATITPSDATAVTTNQPTVDMPSLFWVPTWNITEDCITVAPQIYVHPNPVDYGNIPVGVPSSETVTISNTGTANLLISSMSVGSPFVLTSSCAGFNLIPGASCDAAIEVTPGTTGALAATLTVGSDDPVTPLLEIPVLVSVFDATSIFSDNFESGDTTAWDAVEP